MNRNTKDISTDLLLRVLYSLGYPAKIKFQKAARPWPRVGLLLPSSVPNSLRHDFPDLIVAVRRADDQVLFSLGIAGVVV
jgi:hypothetical protein